MNDSKAPKWFQEFEKGFQEFKIKINERLDRIENDIQEMKNTPTMRRELNT